MSRSLNEAAKNVCGINASKKSDVRGSKFEPYSEMVVAFTVAKSAPSECVHMAMAENQVVFLEKHLFLIFFDNVALLPSEKSVKFEQKVPYFIITRFLLDKF
jgi:hypothetical protein